MNHRVISSDEWPQRLIEHIRTAGCISRGQDTAYRGPLAIVGGGQIHAVANLRDVKPISGKSASGFLWCIDEIEEIEVIPCAPYSGEATFLNGSALEPNFLNAGAQEQLNRLLQGAQKEEVVEEVTTAVSDERGQFALF